MNHSCVTWWRIHMKRCGSVLCTREMTLSNDRSTAFIWDMTYLCVTPWRIHMKQCGLVRRTREMTLSNNRSTACIWDMTHSYETWLIHMRHDLFVCVLTYSYGPIIDIDKKKVSTQHTETHCNTLTQHTSTRTHTPASHQCQWWAQQYRQHTAPHCNTLQHTATHCTALQRALTHLHLISVNDELSNIGNTLQHTATHCNTLHAPQHALTHLHFISVNDEVSTIGFTILAWCKINLWDMTHSFELFVGHDSFIWVVCGTWLIHLRYH